MVVYDAPLDGRASRVAAGIVNPVVLRRTVPSWRASEMLAIAGAFYRSLEQRYDATFWHPMPLVAIFPTAQEAGIWHLRMKDPELGRMLAAGPSTDPGIASLPQPYGHGLVQRSAWLDVQALLDKHRERWIATGGLIEGKVDEADMRPIAGGIAVHEHSAPLLIDCTGPFSKVAGLVPVRGEGLTVRLPDLALRSMVHRGVFVLPVSGDVYRIGATFAWSDVWSGPTEEGKRTLLERLGRLWSGPVDVLDHWAGVRPAAKDRRPLLGRTGPHTAVINGFGSRGVMLSPWSAQHLAAHLFDGEALDAEVDIARFA